MIDEPCECYLLTEILGTNSIDVFVLRANLTFDAFPKCMSFFLLRWRTETLG